MEWYFLAAIFIIGNFVGQYLAYKYYQRKRLDEIKYFSSLEAKKMEGKQ